MAQPIDERPGGRITALEWVISAIGFVLVIVVIAVLLHRWSGEDDTPADVVVESSRIERGEGGFRVVLRVENLGGVAAESLAIEGVLRDAQGTERERSVVTLDTLGARSRRSAVLVFHRDPREHDLWVGARGFAGD